MRRILMGVVWFVVFVVVLYLVVSMGIGFIATSGEHLQNQQEGVKASVEFVKSHESIIRLSYLGVLVISALAAVVGSVKGILPGTGKSKT